MYLDALIKFYFVNYSNTAQTNHVVDLGHRTWAQFCCKMWEGQLDVKPI